MPQRGRSLATVLLAISMWLFTCGFAVPDTVERDHSLPRVELNGYPFHAETFGDADRPVVIVIHGGPGADYRYLYALKALADEHLVVFYDQRGTGLSPRVPAEQITVQVFIDDLDAFVSAFGKGRPVHLVGHSWGAMLASAYAGAHPHKVAKLVLAEPAFLDSTTMGVMRSGWPGLAVVWGVAKAWVSQWFIRTRGDDYARDDFFLLQVMPLMQGADELCDGRSPAPRIRPSTCSTSPTRSSRWFPRPGTSCSTTVPSAALPSSGPSSAGPRTSRTSRTHP